MEAERNVLVVGATGKQGRSTVKFLLEPDDPGSSGVKFKIQALTRDASSESARQLLERNKQHVDYISLVQGDLDNPDSIKKVFEEAASSKGREIWGVFVALAYPGLGESAHGEIEQAKLLANLALKFKVEVFVYSGAIQVGPDVDDHLDDSHRAKPQIENYCKQLRTASEGLNWMQVDMPCYQQSHRCFLTRDNSILRPGFFMENFDGLIGAVAVSGMRAGLDKDTTINLVASEDIGRVAAGVLRQPDKYMHKTLTISSEAATMEQISESYMRATGQPIPAIPTLAGKALVKFNSALQNVVEEIKRTHKAQTSGQASGLEAGIELAQSVCKLRTYYEWKSEQREATTDKDWNKISLIKLMTGRS